MTGVVPACRSLDCPSVFAFNAQDAAAVFNTAAVPDAEDAYSRTNPFPNRIRTFGATPASVKIGVRLPDQREFYGDEDAAQLFA